MQVDYGRTVGLVSRTKQGAGMVTTAIIGRNTWGEWHPGFMTHSELVRELKTATGDRRAELVREAKTRMKVSTYPPFPAGLVPPSPED